MELEVWNKEGKVVDTITLEDTVLSDEDYHLLYLSVKAYLDNQRLGTAKTKTRGEVRGGGRKPWRQKGTGRARHGSIRSPIWKGGGVTFGPAPRSYYHSLSKKERRRALILALEEKINQGLLRLIEEIDFKSPKTKEAKQFLSSLTGDELRKVLVVTEESKENVRRAFSNLPDVRVKSVGELTTYFVVDSQLVVMEREAFSSLWRQEDE
ncbi:MAG TPA: 50S ribosomal protein L4 [Candidatus Atribacteria bacterium]|jgi:large subunit ribosomal protein L4|uniref:50S ribosomal protein L4 n=1 Tax=Candidatus Sordicultor fermentans TaxID=1953203 RepID=UPI001698EC03|nr:50S ribosomal protein L4 [Atribacterota bacterium]NLY06173.1 50S ribosomal protein L4 [Candidatus Atribacteria bacterium]MDI9607805.1 50S ribosomal protein L4 [Atribacterota bacterium]HOA98736.1 50S ribosomal protein L4 [Candidatus Atribacteria bacterium]HOQ50586.1 50S ribosomal protein L4 [Candidatus Atribacteria bacterium]